MGQYFRSNERSEASYIGLADFFLFFFSGKRLQILMHLVIYAFLRSIEIHLLKVTLLQFSQVALMLSKKGQS